MDPSEHLRVVVADDEPDVRFLLRESLPKYGLEIVGEAIDGDQALEACLALNPEVLVLDLLMPRTTGLQVIPLIQEQCPSVGIVAYTAVAGDFVCAEMERLNIPLVFKEGSVEPLAAALWAAVGLEEPPKQG